MPPCLGFSSKNVARVYDNENDQGVNQTSENISDKGFWYGFDNNFSLTLVS